MGGLGEVSSGLGVLRNYPILGTMNLASDAQASRNDLHAIVRTRRCAWLAERDVTRRAARAR